MTGLPKANCFLSSHPTVGTLRLHLSIVVALVAAMATSLQLGCQPNEQSAVPQLTTLVSDRQPVAERTKEKQPANSQTTIDPYQWQDLFDGKTLDGWNITKFGGEGEVYVKDGTIVMEVGNDMTGITWAGQPPRENFEIQLEGMRLSGSDFFCTTTFPVGKDSCSFVVGGWGGTVTGLSNVDYYDAGDNYTTDFIDFKDKQWYRIRIRVSKEFIRAWVDDKQMVDQEREGHKFGIRNEVDLCRPLGICTWSTTGAVRNIQIRQIDSDPKEPDEN